jgi:hypothetical protein
MHSDGARSEVSFFPRRWLELAGAGLSAGDRSTKRHLDASRSASGKLTRSESASVPKADIAMSRADVRYWGKRTSCERLPSHQNATGNLIPNPPWRIARPGRRGSAHANAAGWPFSRGAGRIADRLTIKRIPPS